MLRSSLLSTLVIALGFAAATNAADSPTTQETAELLSRVRALEAEVAQLKSEKAATNPVAVDRLHQPSAVDAAVADADRRTPLSPEQILTTFDMDRGLVFETADGSFRFHPSLLFQFRNVTNYRDEVASGDSNTQNGFEVRRLWIGFDGHVFDPNISYQFIWTGDRKTGVPVLNDAWVRMRLPETPLAVRIGQIRDPLDHEQTIMPMFNIASERSIVNNVFAAGDGIVQGVSLIYDDGRGGPIRAEVAITDGLRSLNTNFQDFPTTSTNWGVAGRFEWKLKGDWRQYGDFTALNSPRDLLVLGAGFDYTEAGDAAALVHVIDAQYEMPSGLALYAAYLGRYTRNNSGPPNTNGGGSATSPSGPDTYDATVRLQAAYLLDKQWEPFVRYEFIQFDRAEIAPAFHHIAHAFTGGVNYYIHGHHAKMTFDLTYLPDGFPFDEDGSSVLAAKRHEVIIRVQFQLFI